MGQLRNYNFRGSKLFLNITESVSLLLGVVPNSSGLISCLGRRGDLMVSVLDFGASVPGSSP